MPDRLRTRLAAVRATPPAADDVAAAAADAGVLDVAYDIVDTDLGRLLVATTPAGLVRLAFVKRAADEVLDALAARVSPRVLRAPARLAAAADQLRAYLAGQRSAFDLRLDWRLAGPYQQTLLAHAARIPYGQTTTYGRLAAAAGNPRAARAAGRALATNPLCVVVPCHRVVPAGGGLGGYAGGLDAKRRLLELEQAVRPA